VCACSWRVPLTAGSGPFEIIVSEELGEMGRVESEPILYAWGWHHHVPGLAAWMMILALLAIPIAKRRPKSWLIVIPPALAMILWQMPMRLFSMPPAAAQTFDLILTAAAMAWAFAWLVSHWFTNYHPAAAFFLVLTVILAGGAAFCLGHFGVALSDEVLLPLILYCLCGLSLAPAMTLGGYGSRGNCTFKRLALWLGLWVGFALLAIMLEVGLAGTVLQSIPSYVWVILLILVIVTAVVLGAILYFITLPFALAASRRSPYMDQLRDILQIRDMTPWRPGKRDEAAGHVPASVGPTEKKVRVKDVTGQWQFYLDRASRTVTIDFRPDGTFTETIVSNQGDFTECPEGTWRLDGPRIHLDGYVAAESAMSQPRTWWLVDTPGGFAVFGGDAPDPMSLLYMARRLQPTPELM
jgi:hypothetical protein